MVMIKHLNLVWERLLIWDGQHGDDRARKALWAEEVFSLDGEHGDDQAPTVYGTIFDLMIRQLECLEREENS